MALKQIDPPLVEPVSVAEVLDSFRGDDEAAFTQQATRLIRSLRRHAEARIGRALITQTMELVLDAFPSAEIDLLIPNVQSIVSVTYIDPDQQTVTLDPSAYSLDKDSTPSWLLPAYDTTWPETLNTTNALRVRFKVGYGDTAEDVPEEIRDWIITHATQRLGSPDGLSDQAYKPLPFVDRLLDPYIVYRAF